MSHRVFNRIVYRPRPATTGFALIELMVAMTIALFLIGGMMVIFQNVRNTYSEQTSLANLQDNERLAMTLLTDVISSAGYFPNPKTYTAVGTLAASPHFATAGTPVVAGGTTAQGDTITVRDAPDVPPVGIAPDLYNCMAGTNTVAPYDEWENTFSIVSTGATTGALYCTFWSASGAGAQAPQPLVNGLTNGANGEPPGMAILYGVSTGTAVSPTCVDTYMTAAQVQAGGYWGNVCTVKITLTFINPVPPADGTKPWLQFTRVIDIMNATGAVT